MTQTAVASPTIEEERIRQFVTFYIEDGQFGVPLSDVQEIIRMPSLVKVPLAPSALLGLANLRGNVLPVASMRRAMDMEDREPDDSMRVVVINRGVTVGVVVDRMSSVVSTDISEIRSADQLATVSQSNLVDSIFKNASGWVMVFDPMEALGRIFNALVSSDEGSGSLGAGPSGRRSGAPVEEVSSNERRLVSFEIDSQEYAFSIERVKEIVTLPEQVTSIPGASSVVAGAMVLRDEMLPLVSLRRLLRLSTESTSSQQRVVVTTDHVEGAEGTSSVGVVVDTVREVLRIPEDDVDDVPALLRAGGDELEGICRLNEGQRIVSILSVDSLLDDAELQDEIAAHLEEGEGVELEGRKSSDRNQRMDVEEQFVVFRLQEEAYGIPVEGVQEIVRVPEQMTMVPKAPEYFEGVINLRGGVLPVIDQRRRFGLETSSRSDRQRIVVLNIREQLWGFVVDAVIEVRKIPQSLISAAPAMSDAQMRMVRRVANLGDRGIILLLEHDQMISPNEMEQLGQVS